MLDLDASGKWAERMVRAVKDAYEPEHLAPIRTQCTLLRGELADPRLMEIVEKWIGWKQRDFDVLAKGAQRARIRIARDLAKIRGGQ